MLNKQNKVKPLHYVSTRGFGPVSFRRTLFDGLAPDGGLYVPASYPHFSLDHIEEFAYQSYESVAEKVLAPFINNEIPADVFGDMIRKAYANFTDIEVTPLLQYEEDLWILEMFYGPSLTFKDIQLQLYSLMISWLVEEEGEPATMIGATSGDTGAATVCALKNCENINIFMLFPKDRLNQSQQLQITTTGNDNVFPIAIEGSAGDCHRISRELHKDLNFKEKVKAIAINSIAWPLLLPQIVPYFMAWARLKEVINQKPLTFSIPTGSFGNAFACYTAMQCGLPVNKILIANNTNDIVSRFINSGDYSIKPTEVSRSTGLSNQRPASLERLLYDLYGKNSEALNENLEFCRQHKKLPDLSSIASDELKDLFSASSISDIDTLKMISEAEVTQNLIFDPHTAVGVAAAKQHPDLYPTVSLATAHPTKFPRAVKEATGLDQAQHSEIAKLAKKKEVFVTLPNDIEAVKEYILKHKA